MADFREPTVLGRTGLRVGKLGVASSYGVPAAAVEKAYHEYGVNYLYWGSLRRSGLRDAIRNLASSNRKGIVVVTTQVDAKGWPKLFEDAVISEAITDRLTKPAQTITLTGGSYRDRLNGSKKGKTA